MPSSDRRRRVPGWSLCACLVLAACALPGAQPDAPRARPCLAVEQDDAVLAELRRHVENGPFYALAAPGGADCLASRDAGAVSLDYRYADGSRLRVRRDARIEYSEQELRLAAPPAEDAAAILARAERWAFGPAGCGIDWRQPEVQPSTAAPGATEAVFRGRLCNCRARVRYDADRRVIGLALGSAC